MVPGLGEDLTLAVLQRHSGGSEFIFAWINLELALESTRFEMTDLQMLKFPSGTDGTLARGG